MLDWEEWQGGKGRIVQLSAEKANRFPRSKSTCPEKNIINMLVFLIPYTKPTQPKETVH